MKAQASNEQRAAGEPLLELLLNEVVPRLARLVPVAGPDGRPLASPCAPESSEQATTPIPPPTRGPLFSHALELAQLCQQGDYDSAARKIAGLRTGGVSLEAVFLQLIQPAAQHLGQAWLEDRLSFTDVTIGVGHLQRLLGAALDDFIVEGNRHDLAPSTGGGSVEAIATRSIFFCTPKNTHHRLGIQMVRAFFARAGWRTRLVHDDEASLVRQIVAMQPALVGLSLSTDADVRVATGLIIRVRNATRHFKPAIMVGGPAAVFIPALVDKLEADIVTVSPHDALAQADRLLTERQLGTR